MKKFKLLCTILAICLLSLTGCNLATVENTEEVVEKETKIAIR